MDISKTSLSSFSQQGSLAIVGEVGNHFPAVDVGDDGANRHAQNNVICTFAIAVRAATRFAVAGLMGAGKAKVYQRVDVAVRLYKHAAAAPAIAAVRAAFFDIFFTAEAGDAVAAITRKDFDFGFVNKLHVFCTA